VPLVLPNEGLTDWLDWMIRNTGSDAPDLILSLFVNDLVPDQGTVLADMTAASFGGFSERNLTRSGWTVPVIVSDEGVSTWGITPIVWNATTSSEVLYGWFAYQFATMRLMVAERFDVPRPVSAGDVVSLLPRFTLQTWQPCP
jgi:hypothetical protein